MVVAIQSQTKEGSVFGGVLLVAGSCIGAGMLALPVVTGIGGFVPSCIMFLLAWLFMTTTGLLLLEANLTLGHNLSLISIAEKTLGKIGKALCWILFIFLFYSLNIAYIDASGSILKDILADLFDIQIASWVGSTLFTLTFGIVIFIGTQHVDYLNRLLMLGLTLAYCVLVILGSLHINSTYLLIHHMKYAVLALPVLIISFGFHNMVPSLAMYFKGDRSRLRLAVLIGSSIPLVVYLIWEAVMLGIIPIEGREGLHYALNHGQAATEALRSVVGHSWINAVAQLFALFAIVTSFLAQSLSLVDFLADGLKVTKVGMKRVGLILLTLIPPFIFAFLFPGIFIRALGLAGGFSAVILFGIMPALMIWILKKRRVGTSLFLGLVLLVAVAIFFLELMQELGVLQR